MTHYTRTYSGSKKQKDRQAIFDCRDYLGSQRYYKARRLIEEDFRLRGFTADSISRNPMALRKAIRFNAFAMGLAGIQGYPAQALIIDVLREGAKA